MAIPAIISSAVAVTKNIVISYALGMGGDQGHTWAPFMGSPTAQPERPTLSSYCLDTLGEAAAADFGSIDVGDADAFFAQPETVAIIDDWRAGEGEGGEDHPSVFSNIHSANLRISGTRLCRQQ